MVNDHRDKATNKKKKYKKKYKNYNKQTEQNKTNQLFGRSLIWFDSVKDLYGKSYYIKPW